MMDAIQEIKEYLQQARHIVAFTGAGVSTESGVPDFRSAGGIFDRIKGVHYSGPEVLSQSFLRAEPELFYEHLELMLSSSQDAEPNAAHRFFAHLEESGKRVTIITQNVDGLHEAAGSREVLALHGSFARWSRTDTREPVPRDVIHWDATGMPRDDAGHLVRPDVILYEESLDSRVLRQAEDAMEDADLLLVVGSSLQVYPAAGLIHSFRGRHAVLVNRTGVSEQIHYDVVVYEDAGAVFSELGRRLGF